MNELSFFGLNPGAFLGIAIVASILRTVLLLALGIPLVILCSRFIRIRIGKQYTPHHGMIAGKLVFYAGFLMIAIAVLMEFNFPLAPFLGAAGIVGVALGFASQTSVSNIISGVFLVAESAFVVGDIISVGDTLGIILSIDIMSVKLRTFDNKFVRIPNETMIKSQVTNITRFPIRRVDLDVGVAYKEDIGRVRDILVDIAHNNPLCLEEPAPLVIFKGYGSSSIDILFAVWAARTDFLKVKNGLMEEIKKRFEAEGVEIPFPHLSLYKGMATEPFPVTLVSEEKTSGGKTGKTK